jgi:hypothetical protein
MVAILVLSLVFDRKCGREAHYNSCLGGRQVANIELLLYEIKTVFVVWKTIDKKVTRKVRGHVLPVAY